MRRALLTAAVGCAFCLDAPALAATYVTSATGCNGSACVPAPTTLQTFNTSLGVLENVIVEVNVDAIRAYSISFQQYAPDPFATTGSAHLALTGPFSFSLNGTTYSLSISGDQNVSYTIADLGFPSGEFHATGSLTFAVDQALLNTFISGSANCGTLICAVGLTSPASITDTVVSSSNVTFTNFDSAALTGYKLTYVYRPAVPEPESWAMMLVGFSAIGTTIRRRRKPNLGLSAKLGR
jgi:hypothetical protein